MNITPEDLADVVADAIAEVTTPLAARIKALEVQPQLKWCGPYRKDEKYPAGSLVKHANGLWFAVEATTDTPGNGATYWRLLFKRGEI